MFSKKPEPSYPSPAPRPVVKPVANGGSTFSVLGADVTIKGAVTADTTLKWTRPGEAQPPNLAGYRIYWRLTTEPQWTHSVYVGDVTEHTLENVVIDNYFFGVAAVGKDGAESPVVFPGAAGSFGGYAPAPE